MIPKSYFVSLIKNIMFVVSERIDFRHTSRLSKMGNSKPRPIKILKNDKCHLMGNTCLKSRTLY